jgi:transcriptional regulator with XRE-family HTH domain
MELSTFGKFVRRRRVLLEMPLGEMARRLGVSPSFLSSVETGRKSVPKDWLSDVSNILQLNQQDIIKLEHAIDAETGLKKIEATSEESAAFLAAFSRRESELSDKQLSMLTQLLEGIEGSKE